MPVRWLAIVLVWLASAGLPSAWAPAETGQQPRRIVAIGDIHGDGQAWDAIVRAAGLIDARGRWAGGDTILVQTGDVPDRGPDTRRILNDLMRLQREAPPAGGRVVTLVGNHEAMNLTGDLRYVDPGEYAAFADRQSPKRRDRVFAANRAAIEASYRAKDPAMKPDAVRKAWIAATPLGWVEHRAAWLPSGEIGKWIAANPAVARIGDTIFVHGGLSPAFAALPIEEINRRVAAELAAADDTDTAAIHARDGPLWYRGLAENPGEVGAVLAATGAARIAIGHTPNLPGVAIVEDGRLIRLDSGISRAYGGTLGWLEINGGEAVAHQVPRPPQHGGSHGLDKS